MDKLFEIHNKAMELAETAEIAKRQGNHSEYASLIKKAFALEKNASNIVSDDISNEPTRSVLLRSAASLAIDCNEYREAERLISLALIGNPHEEIADELRDLFEQIQFGRHLDLKGIKLSPNEVQLSIFGKSVSHGVAKSDEVSNRVINFERMIYRTAERKSGEPYRERGEPKKSITNEFQIYQTIPRAASFAITLMIGLPEWKKEFQFDNYIEEVIDEVMDALDLVEKEEYDDLYKVIDDETYFRNFLSLTKLFAPTGEDVNQVGLTTLRRGKPKSVTLTKTKKAIVHADEIIKQRRKVETKEVTGILKYADSRKENKDRIRVIDDKKTNTYL